MSDPLLHCNPFINLFKIPTKIWGYHVMFLNLVKFQFCTTTYLNISLKLPPKLGDVSGSILFIFMQKPSYVLWKIWVNQPHFHSGPTWWFVLQPYFNLLLYPWFLFLLMDHPAKPLRPGEWTHWSMFGPCNDAIYLLSRTEDLQNLH